MRKLILFLLICISAKVNAQVYQEMPQYGYRANRMAFDSTLQIPSVCGVPTLKSNVTKKSAIAYDTCNAKFYVYNSKTLTWSELSGGGGGSTDTTSLSNRINLKLSIADTSAMLNPYLRKIDTTNQFVKSVASINDSIFRVIKGTTTTDITIKSVTNSTNAKRLITEVYNNSGVTITKGSVVYINGRHSSNYPTILPAQANSEENSYKTFAIVDGDISDQSTGYVVQAGSITGLNLPTSTYTDGDIVYLSPTIAGGLTIVKPLAPFHICKIGSIVRAHPTLGAIEIKIENGWQLDELSDVSINVVPADSTLLQFSRVDSLWHDVSVTNAIGTKYLKPTDTISLSNRIENKPTNLDLLQLMSYGIKAEPYGITLANMSSQQGLVTNRLFLYPFNWNVSDTLRGVAWFNRAAFTNTATNYNGIAIYSLSGGTLTRIMFTANDGTFWNTAINSWTSRSLTATYLTKGIYFIGYQFSGSGTPTIGSGAPLVIAGTQSPSDPPNTSIINPNGIKFSTFIANATATPPTSIAMSTTTAVVNVPYFLFY